MESFSTYLIICPLVFFAGFVDAVVGGGGFISLPAYMISGFPVHMAIGTNKLSSAMGTSLATYRFAKSGYIKLKIALYCAFCALVGSTVGAKTALLISDNIFKIMMLIVLPLTALYVFFNKNFGKTDETENDDEIYSDKKTIFIGMIIALILGFYDGFYGPGTGTFLILLLTGIAHMTLKESNGVAKVINLTTNLASLSVFILNQKVVFHVGLIAGLFCIAGSYLGTKFFSEKGSKIVKPLIMLILIIFFIKVLMEILA